MMKKKFQFHLTQLRQFLNVLFKSDDLIELRCIETWVEDGQQETNVRRRYWLATDEICDESMLDELRSLNITNAANIFFGVCPRPAEKCGKSRDIGIIRCFWADVDDCDPGVAKKRIHEANLPEPSIIVNSGRGVHLYWLLNKPLIVEKQKHRQEIQMIIKAIQQSVGGDHAQDLARLLRLPGFMNVKGARNGVGPVACCIVSIEPGRRYPLALFSDLIAKSEPKNKTPQNSKYDANSRLERALTRLEKAPIGERSEVDFGACCECLRAGLSKEVAWNLVKGKSKFTERGRSYFELVWEKALKEVGGDSLGKGIESFVPSSIEVLGTDEDLHVIVWIKDTHRVHRMPKFREVDAPALIQIVGQKAFEETEAGIQLVKTAIAEVSRQRVFQSDNCIGSGIWRIPETPGILLLSGDRALVVNKSEGSILVDELQTPVVGKNLLEFNAATKWIDLDWLQEFMQTVDCNVTKRLWEQLVDYLSCWEFHLKTGLDIVASMILATPIQGTLQFRPHIWVTGATNTGKTALFTFLGHLWPHAFRFESETSEAAVRQTMQRSCLPALYDEFETWHGRSRVIKLLRSSTRGSYVVKGTPSHKPIKFGLRHIFWLASIDVSLWREADRNRFLVIELDEPDQIRIPDSRILNQFGQELICASVFLADRIDALYQEIVNSGDARKYGRFGESLALPAAIKAAFLDCDVERANQFFNDFKEDRKALLSEMTEPDYADLLAYICCSTVWAEVDYEDPPARKPCQIGDLIQQGKGLEELSNNGIRILDDKRIYLCPTLIRRKLLKNEPWKDVGIRDILKRIPGAEESRLRIGGYNLRGYIIPRSILNLGELQEMF